MTAPGDRGRIDAQSEARRGRHRPGDWEPEAGSWSWNPQSDEVLWSNQMFELFGYETGEVEPSLDAAIGRVHPDDRDTLRKLIDLQRGDPHERAHPFRVIRPDGEVRVLLGIAALVTSERGQAPTLIGTVQDVTDERLTSHELAAHLSISRTFAAWESLRQPLVALLGDLGAALGWNVGALWVPDAERDVLECVAVWAEPGLDASELEAATRSFRFPATAIIGRAWKTRAPAAVDDLVEDPEFLRRDPAMDLGLRSWVSFPALHGDEVIAVAELLSHDRRTFDRGLNDSLTSVGRIVGEFLARKRADLQPRVRLTERERQVLKLVAGGASATDSGRTLGVAPATIKSHLRNVYEKLGVSSRAAAVAEAMRLGLID
jgi:PAS domain S-box-containing protein